MNPSPDLPAPKPIFMVFRDWVIVIPLMVACASVAGFVLYCWLGDGTVASLYRVEYFMPLPLYCLVVSFWAFLPMSVFGIIVAGVVFTSRRLRAFSQNRSSP